MTLRRKPRPFDRIALIGIGLIGSSLARVIKKHKLTHEIAISTRRRRTLDPARKLKLVTRHPMHAAHAGIPQHLRTRQSGRSRGDHIVDQEDVCRGIAEYSEPVA